MNFHRGAPIQQGAGLGSMFSGLFRSLIPAATGTLGKYAKMEATRAAVDTALEAIEGKPVGAAAKRRLKTATKNILKASKRKESPNIRGRGRGAKRKNVKFKRRKVEDDQIPLFDDVDDVDYEDEYNRKIYHTRVL